MTTAKKYLEILREREPQLWKEPLKESGFTEKDLSDIEKGLGYKLSVPYREFLLSYKMPGDITVFVSFEVLGSIYCISQLMMKGRSPGKVTYFVSWRNWTDRILFNVIQTTIAKNFLKKDK